MTDFNSSPQKLKGRAKMAVEFGPLLVFFLAYFFGERIFPGLGKLLGQDWSVSPGREMFLAVSLFMPAFAIAFLYSVWKERRLAPMLLISGIIIGLFGSLTLIFENKTFFYMKPTIVYLLFAMLLGGGLMTGRNFLKTAFDEAFTLKETAWHILTVRFIVFFGVMALINEIAWRWLTRDCDLVGLDECAGEAAWVNLKIFGFTLLSMIFTGAQIPYIMRHSTDNAGMSKDDISSS